MQVNKKAINADLILPLPLNASPIKKEGSKWSTNTGLYTDPTKCKCMEWNPIKNHRMHALKCIIQSRNKQILNSKCRSNNSGLIECRTQKRVQHAGPKMQTPQKVPISDSKTQNASNSKVQILWEPTPLLAAVGRACTAVRPGPSWARSSRPPAAAPAARPVVQAGRSCAQNRPGTPPAIRIPGYTKIPAMDVSWSLIWLWSSQILIWITLQS